MADYTPDATSAPTEPSTHQPEQTFTPPEPIDPEEVIKTFHGRIETAKRNRKQYHSEWKRNVELRLGMVASQSIGGVGTEDEVKTEINPDWWLTKTKIANLYSQMPQVQLTHENKQYAAAIPPFSKSLNYEMGEKRANVSAAMEEALNDVVNAAGIGAVIVTYSARFEDRQVPQQDTALMPQAQVPTMMQAGQIQTATVPMPISDKFSATRISPVDLLWPSEFTGSCFDDADWIGRTGRMSWAEAKSEFNLSDADKDKVLGGDDVAYTDDLRSQPEKEGLTSLKIVKFDEIYYWRYRVDPAEKSFKAIWRMVFVKGLDKPAIHEPWKGQQYDQQSRKYVGSCKPPIRILTLTYVSDNPVPPSDSSAGRPQVNDLRRSRQQMFQNRQRSLPLRWYDVNRIDFTVQDQLMRGTFQGIIPTNGDGSRSIGEIARASYPSEDLTFDRQCMADLEHTWQIDSRQMGVIPGGEKATKGEVQTSQANFATRIGQERYRVAMFFLGIAEVMSGLMVLYSDWPILTEQERQGMEQVWNRKQVLHDLVFKIRPDSTIMLDSQTRIQRLMQFINMTAKSGFVNVMPVITEIAELSGVDPTEVVVQPKPPEPEPAKASLSIKGKEDLLNPLLLAFLIRSKQAPNEQEIEAAKQLLVTMQGAVQPPQQPQQGQQPHPGDAKANEDWQLQQKIAKRQADVGGPR